MRQRLLWAACVVLLALTWACSAVGSPAPTVVSVSSWKAGAAPMAWANGRVFYNRRSCTTCPFRAYSAAPDGTDERTLTAAFPTTTNDGVQDVTKDGRYALMVVERANHWPTANGDNSAAPGAGAYNDLWLLDLTTGQTWKLIDLLKTGTSALIWPRFNATGTKVVWSEEWQASWFDLGKWTLHTADLAWTTGTPRLTNPTTRKTQSFTEPYGFLDDGTVLAAVSDLVGNGWSNAQIARVPVDPTKPATRLSPEVPFEDWAMFANYSEFAYVMPLQPDRIMFGRTYGATNGSIELWTMGLDGSSPQRLTYLSDPSSPTYQGSTVILGGLAFDPNDSRRFVAGYGTDYSGGFGSVVVTLS